MAGSERASPPDSAALDSAALDSAAAGSARADMAAVDTAGLVFAGEMYGVQLDQLAAALRVTPRRAAAAVRRWQSAGWAQVAVLSRGPRWVWLTRSGLSRCGLPYAAGEPGLSRLAHLRAVTAVRLAFMAAPECAAAHWRSERRIRSRIGGRIGSREHVPDGELHWPETAVVPWAGECWAIEAELTPKTAARTAAIMRELLGRTGDYGCAAADVRVAGAPARHARVVYVCGPGAATVVRRARAALGAPAARIELRSLPPGAALPAPAPAGPAP